MEIGLIDFQGVRESRKVAGRAWLAQAFPHTVISSARLVEAATLGRDPVTLQELDFGLLHASCGIDVAERRSNALQGVFPTLTLKSEFLAGRNKPANSVQT